MQFFYGWSWSTFCLKYQKGVKTSDHPIVFGILLIWASISLKVIVTQNLVNLYDYFLLQNTEEDILYNTETL